MALTVQLATKRPLPTRYARGGPGEGCTLDVVGSCGDLRFTNRKWGFGAETRYFNLAGELVAAVTGGGDLIGPNQDCPTWTHYGVRVTCENATTVDYCVKRLSDVPPADDRSIPKRGAGR